MKVKGIQRNSKSLSILIQNITRSKTNSDSFAFYSYKLIYFFSTLNSGNYRQVTINDYKITTA